MRSLVAVFVLATAPSLQAQSQSTGAPEDASAPKKQEQEKEKKKEQPKAAPRKPAPRYTDDDLKKARETGRGNVVILTDPAGSASAAPSDVAESGQRSLDAERKFWQVQAGQHRQAITNAEGAIRAIEARIGELTSDIAPNPGDLFDPSRLQKREAEKQQQLKALEAAKANLEAARKTLADFEEQALRQGIPSSWLQP